MNIENIDFTYVICSVRTAIIPQLPTHAALPHQLPSSKNNLPHAAKIAPNQHDLLNHSITRLRGDIVEVSKERGVS